MANTVEHSIRLSGDNTKLKKILKESDALLKNNARSTTEYSKVLSNAFEGIHRKVKELNKSLMQMGSSLGGGAGGGLMGKLKGLTGLGIGIAGMGLGFAGAAVRQRMQTASTGLQLNAIGAGGGYRSNTAMGFGVQQTLSQRLSLAKSVGGIGGGLDGIQALARVTGMDPSEIIGSASARRGSGSSRGESLTAVRRTMGILSQTLGETFDKGRLGEFMSSIDSTLMSIGSGVNVDERSFVQAFSNLIKNPTLGSNPQRAANALGAVDNAFKTASGNNFGLIAQIMSGAMGGNASALDLTFESRRGLFAKGKLGGKDRQSSIFGSMKNFFEQSGMGGSGADSSRLRALTLQDRFGVQGADVARALGDAIASGQTSKAAKLAKGFETPESLQKQAMDIMSSTDGGIMSMQVIMSNMLDEIGGSIAPNLVKITSKITGSAFGSIMLGTQGERSARIDKQSFAEDKSGALSYLDKLEMPGFNLNSGTFSERGGLFRSLSTPGRLSKEERSRIGTALNQEIAEGKRLLDGTNNPTKQDAIVQMLEKLERFVAALESIEKKEKNAIINVSNSRGRTQDVTTKSIGVFK